MRHTGERMSAIQAENLIGTVASMLGTVVNAALPIVEGEPPLDGNRFAGILPPVSEAPPLVLAARDVRRHGPGRLLAVCWRQWRAERALARRGVHFRSDYPVEEPDLAAHTVLRLGQEPVFETWT